MLRSHFADPPRRFRFYLITHALEKHLSADSDALLSLVQSAEELEASVETRSVSPTDFVRYLADLGYGGIVTNVDSENYLHNDASWQVLREGVQAAGELGMVVWIYDEKGYPSGTAGGLVLEGHPELQASGLTYHWQEGEGPGELSLNLPQGQVIYTAAVSLSGEQLRLQEARDLTHVAVPGQTLRWSAPAGRWRLMAFVQQFLYEGTHGEANFSEKRPCINLLDPRAAARFIEVTHEAYARRLGDCFGQPIEAFFTDEPSLMTGWVGEKPMPFAALPWVEHLPQLFQEKYGIDLIPMLPSLFHDVGEETGKVRAQFYDLVAGLCADAYFGALEEWCETHNLASTGHLLWEEFLLWHVSFESSAFAAMRRFHIPGMDRLSSKPDIVDWDGRRSVSAWIRSHAGELQAEIGGARLGTYADIIQAKKAWIAPKLTSSIAHCAGKIDTMVELSAALENWLDQETGVTDVRATLNWLYVLGINTVTSYYGWNRFSPAESRAINEYAGRLGVLLTQGHHVADVAVLYPITSLWAHFVPTCSYVREMEQDEAALAVNDAFDEVGRVLLTHQRDFDFVDDTALAEAVIEDGALNLYDERYRALILPPTHLIRRGTMQKILDFHRAGGLVIALEPLLSQSLEVGPDPQVKAQVEEVFASGKGHLVADAGEMMKVLRAALPPDLHLAAPCSHILYHHRRTDDRDIYFIVHQEPTPISLDCQLSASGQPILWDPLTGEVGEQVAHTPTPEGTQISLQMEGYAATFVVFDRST